MDYLKFLIIAVDIFGQFQKITYFFVVKRVFCNESVISETCVYFVPSHTHTSALFVRKVYTNLVFGHIFKKLGGVFFDATVGSTPRFPRWMVQFQDFEGARWLHRGVSSAVAYL